MANKNFFVCVLIEKKRRENNIFWHFPQFGFFIFVFYFFEKRGCNGHEPQHIAMTYLFGRLTAMLSTTEIFNQGMCILGNGLFLTNI